MANPNFFYDTKYITPWKVCAYEYSRLDPENKVDYSGWFDEGMLDAGLVTDEGYEYIKKYRTVPGANNHAHSDVGIEIDCGPSLPALFVPLIPSRPAISQDTLDGLADITDCPRIPMPVVPYQLRLEEVGIFPGRGTGVYRFMIRGNHAAFKEFADAQGCVNTDIITQAVSAFNQSALSFDWDGENMTNFTFYSPDIFMHDRWVNDRTIDASAKIAEVYAGIDYTIRRHVKVSLNPAVDPNYMKIYFSVFQK